MNDTDQLDTFESALLTELRREVAERPRSAPVPARRPRRRRLRLAAVGATGVAASVVAVFGLGSTGGSPAFAVAENSAGDVTVTVHRLDDAAGLEKALRAKGIDADVSYDATSNGSSAVLGSYGPQADASAPPPGAQAEGQAAAGSGSAQPGGEKGPTLSAPGSAPGGADDPCGPIDPAPARLTHPGDDWVLSIPAGSPLQDRHVVLGTGPDGALSVEYAGTQPGTSCGLMSISGRAPGTP
jgi:hypothetical protein